MPQCNLLAWLMGMVLAVSSQAAVQEPLLQIHGKPYFGGQVTIQVKAPDFVGLPAALAYGLEPLSTPVGTGKGAWFIGDLYKVLLLGTVPPTGVIALMIDMPPETPGLEGLVVVAQGFAAPRLSNPAELRLDRPYLTASQGIQISPPLPIAGAAFGDRVRAGDFDGDGHEDLVVGAAYEGYQGVAVSGSVYVMWGPDWIGFTEIRPPEPVVFGGFGFGLAAADFDQDGRDDIVITQSGADPFGPTDFARVYAVFGATSRSLTPSLVAVSPTAGVDAAHFGRFPATGDLTADGFPDVVVGAQGTSVNGTPFSGVVMLLAGPDLSTSTLISNPTPVGNDFFGSVLRVADVDGDQYLDLVESSGRADILDPQSNDVVVNAGELHVLYGPDLSSWTVHRSPLGPAFDDRFGETIVAGDLDQDGKADLAAASLTNTSFVVWSDGSPVQSIPKPAFLFTSPLGDSSFGYSGIMLDVNGDGLDDYLIGDPFEGELQACSVASSGTAWAALAPRFATFATAEPVDPQCQDLFAWDLWRHDMNGDSILDLIAGVRSADDGLSGALNAGKVVVYLSH